MEDDHGVRILAAGIACALLHCAAPTSAQTWSETPLDNNWSTAANWNPATVPSSISALAVLGTSTLTNLSITSSLSLGTLRFEADADPFSLTISGSGTQVALFGAGVDNLSIATQPLITLQNGGLLAFNAVAGAGDAALTNDGGWLVFFGNSTADAANVITTNGGHTQFYDNTSAGNAHLTTEAGTVGGPETITEFYGNSNAGSATITTDAGGRTLLYDSSSAGSAVLIANAGGLTEFAGGATADNATVITNAGGRTEFADYATGDNATVITNAGGTFDISGLSAGWLSVGSIAGSGNYSLGDRTLEVSGHTNTTVSGNITGTGGVLIKTGSGALTLTGANTYSGGTTIEGGTLQGNTASLQGRIINNGSVIFDQSADGTYSGNMDGVGSLTKSGAGTLTLTGMTSYSGGTTIQDGALRGGLASLANNTSIVDNGHLIFDESGIGGYAGIISGSGSVAKEGAGRVDLLGTNTYAGGTFINAGTLAISADSNLGDASGGLTFNGGTLLLTNNVSTARDITLEAGGGTIFQTAAIGPTSTLSGEISGTGQLTKTGSGRLILTGANTYSGGTRVSQGSLAGNSTSLQGNISVTTAAANIIFDQATDGTYSGIVSGPGLFDKNGAGKLTITGAITNGSSVRINQGTLEIAAGASINKSTSSSITVGAMAADNGTLRVNGGTVNLTGTMFLGSSGTGALDVLNGGSVSTGGLYVGYNGTGSFTVAGGGSVNSGASFIASQVGSTGTATVTGTGTNWNSSSASLFVGNNGTGTLTVADGATVRSGSTGAGTVYLAYASGSAGTLNIGAGGAAGTIAAGTINGRLGTAATVNFNHTGTVAGGDYTFAPNLTGILHVNQIGTGTTILTGANTHTGGTTIDAGTLAISADSSLGNVSGGLTFGGGTLRTDGSVVSDRSVSLNAGGGIVNTNSFDSTLSGLISGTGDLTKTGTGTLTLSGTNTYAGGTSVSAGALRGNSASLQGTIVNDAAVIFDQTTDGTYSGPMSGSGTLTKSGTGTLMLNGTNTYSGGTIINSGTLSVSGNSNLGSAGSALTFGGGTLQTTSTFTLARDAMLNTGGGGFDVTTGHTLTLDGNIAGAGSLRKLGEGTLVLTAASNYSGGTTVVAGTLQGDTASLHGNITNNATLAFDQEIDGTYYGVISGTGALTKLGTGNLVLGGVNTYTGPTRIDRGTLSVNGALSSSVMVGSGARLGGTGTIGGAVTVGDGGTLSAGNSIGTMTIGGPLTIAAGSRLVVEADATGRADRIDVTGASSTATISGGTLRVEALGASDGFQRGTTYTVLTATGGVSGAFDAVSSNLPFLTPTILYDQRAVRLTLNRSDVLFSEVAETPNETSVASYLDAVVDDPGIRSLISGLEGLSSEQARSAFEQMGGDGLSGLSRISIADTARFQNMIATRLGTGGDSGLAFATDTPDRGGGAWVRVTGGRGSADPDDNAMGYRWDSTGTAAGIETRIGSRALLGGSLFYTRSDVNLDDATAGSATITTPQVLAYGSYTSSGTTDRWRRKLEYVQLRGSAGYATHQYDTQRRVAIGSNMTTARAAHDGQEVSAHGDVELVKDFGDFRVQALFGLRYSLLREAGYAESGSAANLDVNSRETQSVASTAGLRYVGHIFGNAALFDMRAMWNREFGDIQPTLSAGLADAVSDTRFTVDGAPLGRDSITVGAGLSGRIGNGVFLYADCQAELRSLGQTQQSIIAGVSYVW